MLENNSINLSVPLDTVRRFVNGWPLAPIARSQELKPMATMGFNVDYIPIVRYRNALTAAKRALTEINETSDDVSAWAAWGLAKIAEELDWEQH